MRLIDLDKAVSICDEDNNTVIFANIENAEVKAIPIEWIERKLAEHWYVDYDIREMLEDWEKENEID